MIRCLPTASVLMILATLSYSACAGEMSSPPHRTVLDYGAIGDGRADDTSAIQKAIDAGLGSIRLPKGIYRITRPIVVDLDKTGYTSVTSDGTSRIVMAGAGPALKFVGTHEGTAAPRTFRSNVWERQRMPIVDGIEIVGVHPQAVGLEAAGTMQLTITRTTIRECLHGIHLTRRNRNIVIADCHIYRNAGIGIFYDQVNLHQSNIVGSHISYCDGGGIVLRGGDVRNVHVGTCDIEANHGRNGPPTANILIDCSSSVSGTAEAAITGCTIQHTSDAPDSANIRILGRGFKDARGQAEWGHVTITGNVLSDVVTNIHLAGTRGVTLTGNTLWMGYKHNLLVEDCSQIVVGSNVFERNPAYDYGSSKTTCNAIVFRSSRDCTLTGLHVEGVRGTEAGLLIEGCERFNITGCTILDYENTGLLARQLIRSRISGCLIRNDRPATQPAMSLKVVSGLENQVVDNLLSPVPAISSGAKGDDESVERK